MIDSPLRIAFLCEGDAEDASQSGSGTPKFLVDALRSRGAEVRCADVDLAPAARAIALGLSVSSRKARWRSKYHLLSPAFALRSWNASRAADRAAAAGCDAIVQYGATFRPTSASVPYFCYCDSNVLRSSRNPYSWGAQLTQSQLASAVARQREVYSGATAIFTFSDFIRRSFIEDFQVAAERVLTVGAGANLRVTGPENVAARTDEARAPTLLFVGREFERKGGDLLLRAFARVRERVPNATLVIIGPNEAPESQPGVQFLGRLQKSDPGDERRLAESYSSADVFCFPTRHEPFGLVVLEAMLHGLPVVASNVWALPEMVLEGETGYVVRPDDMVAFADRVTELLLDPVRARAMGARGRARVEAIFRWDLVAERMLTAIRSFVCGRTRTARVAVEAPGSRAATLSQTAS